MKDKYLIGGDVWVKCEMGDNVWATSKTMGSHYYTQCGMADSGIIHMEEDVMQRLVEQGIATEVPEPFEKTVRVTFDESGTGGNADKDTCDLIRTAVGNSAGDMASVANKTYDVIVKEVVE